MIKHQQRKQLRCPEQRFRAGFYALLLLLLLCGAGQAQSISARISVLSLSPGRVKIEGERAVPTTVWSFRNQYGNAGDLGERIESLTLSDKSGVQITARKIAPGEYSAAGPATRFAYEVKLNPPTQTSAAALASWLTEERGLLLPGDLLPRLVRGEETENSSAHLSFNLPATWSVATSELRQANGEYRVVDPERAVFLAGAGLRQKEERIGPLKFSFVTSGRWAFTDEEAASMAAQILKDHAEVSGWPARQNAMLILIPFPLAVGADRWSAETRGATIMLLSGQAPSKIAALAQLSFPLTHELFHLWVPNGLALDGDYDWFYEGFTLYQALRAGMRLRLFSFQDYLNALSRAFDAYNAINGRDQLSLVEASKERWRSRTGLIYHKGLLIAFLYDLTLRQKTKNKRSLDDVYRELFRRAGSRSERADGNSVVISILKNQSGMQEFVSQYIEKPVQIDLRTLLMPFGLEVSRGGGFRTHLNVSIRSSGAQRDLLRKFGYNEETRPRP